MDDQEYWNDLYRQGTLLHSRLRELFEAGQVRLHTSQIRIPNTPEAKLAQYLHLLQTRHSLFKVATTDEEKSRRNKAIAGFCIKEQDFPEQFFKARRKRDAELGLGQIALSSTKQQQLINAVIIDQQKRLKQWVKFLNSPEADFPVWFRFYVLSNIVKLREFDTAREVFPRRSLSSTANFPELNEDVVHNMYRYISDPIFVQSKSAERAQAYLRLENRDSFRELPAQDASFANLYSFWTNDYLMFIMDGNKARTKGQWVTFEKDSRGLAVASALSGHNTGWCSANIGQAADQLKKGDVHIYLTEDSEGQFNVPRILIRMDNEQVKEVRGRLPKQEIEPDLVDIANEKLSDLKGGNRYFRLVNDMKKLTDIVKRNEKGEDLNREDLIFIYQIEKPVIGFGTDVDPRLVELRDARDARSDLAYIFGCTPENVALCPEEMHSETQVCAFNIDRKTIFPDNDYDAVIAVVGNVNLERTAVSFPSLTFVSGYLRLKYPHENISIVRGQLQYSNGYGGLENLTMVGGSAMFSSTKGEFPKLTHIGGALHAAHSIIEVPSLQVIDGDAWLDGARIKSLPDNLNVAGEIHGTMAPFRSDYIRDFSSKSL